MASPDFIRVSIEALSDEAFEGFVHELVVEEVAGGARSRTQKMKAPDGGADSLVYGSAGQVDQAFQVKHYPKSVHWDKCIASLDRAIQRWEPAHVRFVFPQDFTEPKQKSFRAKLASRHVGVSVDVWTMSDLVALAQKHDRVTARYLGPDSLDVTTVVERATRMGGADLRTAKDLISRAHELGKFADELDPNFTYRQSSGPLSAPEPQWDTLPYLTVHVEHQSAKVRVDAWARDDETLGLPKFAFTNDEAGRNALEKAREELAAGKEVQLESGFGVELGAMPKVLEGIEDVEFDHAAMSLSPGRAIPLAVSLETDEGTVRREFQLRPVFPLQSGHAAFACRTDALWVELDVQPVEFPTINLTLRVSARFGRDAAENAAAADFVLAVRRQRTTTLEASALLPDEGVSGHMRFEADDGVTEELALRRDLYRDLALIEARTGTSLPIPEAGISNDDLAAIGGASTVLEQGGGAASLAEATGIVEAVDIPRVEEKFARDLVIRQPVTYVIFGQEVVLGTGEYELPPVKLVRVAPLGTRADAPARVTVAPVDDTPMRFRLVD